MNKFEIVRRGYNVAQVEEYLSNKDLLDKQSLLAKNQRVEELKAEVSRLISEQQAYKKKEESVNLALITAIEKANEIECQTKLRFTLECERIKLFRGKWTAFVSRYSHELGLALKMDEFNNSLEGLERELADMMRSNTKIDEGSNAKNDPQAQYLEESKRLIAKLKSKNSQKQQDALSAQFNLDEINNPPKLEDLCKDLGLTS